MLLIYNEEANSQYNIIKTAYFQYLGQKFKVNLLVTIPNFELRQLIT